MSLSQADVDFLGDHHMAAMITTTEEGVAKVARVGVALVDGRLWSSGTADRVRTKRLRRDPKCTLFVFDPGFAWLSLETTVTILDGPDAPQLTLRLFRHMQGNASGPLNWFGRQLTEDEFLEKMVEEGRVVYEFDVHRTYGMH